MGDARPDFTLPATGDRNVSLSDYAGQPVVLVFYPGDDTPVCTKQLNSYNDELEQFTELNAQVLGISAQDVSSHDGVRRQARVRVPVAGRHRQDGRRAVRHARARSGSPAAACSSSMPAAWSATPTGRSPGSRTDRSRNSSPSSTSSPDCGRSRTTAPPGVHRLTPCCDLVVPTRAASLDRHRPAGDSTVTPLRLEW